MPAKIRPTKEVGREEKKRTQTRQTEPETDTQQGENKTKTEEKARPQQKEDPERGKDQHPWLSNIPPSARD